MTKTETASKIKSLEGLKLIIPEWKESGQKIVFTNGCFDILHLGHVDYLERAAALGDKLIIGLNSDASISRLKGAERPICDGMSRARILAALTFVDAVVFFEEDTPYNLILTILPDILVKGEDYKPENIIGADIVMQNNGKVETIKFIDGYSTSSIINKIKQLKN